MGIFKRLSDIVSANLSDMVDDSEDPIPLLQQAVREMETAIAKARPEVAKAMANEKTVAKELASNERESQSWAERAAAAVGKGDDALARKALVRKREHEKVIAALKDQHEAAAEAAQGLRRQLEAMQAKLADAQRRLGTLQARKKAAEVRAKMSQVSIDPELSQDAFAKFERLSRKVEMAEAEAEAYAELSKEARHATPADEERSASDEDLSVEEDLARLKRKHGHAS